MENTVIVDIERITLTEKQKCNSDWQMKLKLANQDLDFFQKSILRELTHDIPLKFDFPIVIKLSGNLRTAKINMDYSQIPDRRSIKLIKLYLNGGMSAFYAELAKTCRG